MRQPEARFFRDQIKAYAAKCQVEVGELLCSEVETPSVIDRISELKEDLKFYSRVLRMLNDMTGEKWKWMRLHVYLQPDTVKLEQR